MSDLISYGTGTEPDAPSAISNSVFWPDIDPADFADTNRVDSSITAPRVEDALRVAMADVNRQLKDWQAAQEENGAETIDDVSPPSWSTADHYTLLYTRAIYATARASLYERYLDHSATNSGDEKGEAKNIAADDYRRDARWAIAELIGKTHMTVELI